MKTDMLRLRSIKKETGDRVFHLFAKMDSVRHSAT